MTRLVHAVADRKEDFVRIEKYRSEGVDTLAKAGALWPRAVEIQPTARCHRVCTFCSHIVRNKTGLFFDLTKMQSLLQELLDCEVSTLAISGGGEPLYWGWDNVIPLLKTARQFSEVSLTSSCDQFWRRETRDLHPLTVEALGLLDRIYVNVPAVGAESWNKLVKNGNTWEETESMLRAIVRVKAQSPTIRCTLFAVVVLTESNLDQLSVIDKTFTEIGFDGIYYKDIKNFEQRNLKRLTLEKPRLLSKLDEVCASGQPSASLLAFRRLTREESFGRTVPCWANRVSASAVIDPTGDVYNCTPTVGLPRYSIGNVHQDSFRNIWRSGLRRAVLAALDKRSLDMKCPAECREHPFNSVAESIFTEKFIA